ncbi:hypothetical protein [Peterkaempfera bronchialis]|uniref:hypothetical protein n=1 Tax=Peterkaempfera bronchialis TaxID=2126346 RepID=UPI001E3EC99F|nr:hypothetical protein [Peterkaempfera bronchialis]
MARLPRPPSPGRRRPHGGRPPSRRLHPARGQADRPPHLEGRLLPKPDHDRQADAVRRTLPADQATRLLAEENWAALAATLAQAEAAGHDPTTLLNNAAGRRELATADSPAAVLTWRIRRDANLPTPAPAATPDELRTRAARARTTSRTTGAPATPVITPPTPVAPDQVRRTR